MTLHILLLEDVHASADDILQTLPDARIRRPRHAPGPAELKDLLADVEVLGLRSRTQLDAAALAAAPRPRAVGAYCTGTDNIDLKAAAERGVAVFNGPFSSRRGCRDAGRGTEDRGDAGELSRSIAGGGVEGLRSFVRWAEVGMGAVRRSGLAP